MSSRRRLTALLRIARRHAQSPKPETRCIQCLFHSMNSESITNRRPETPKGGPDKCPQIAHPAKLRPEPTNTPTPNIGSSQRPTRERFPSKSHREFFSKGGLHNEQGPVRIPVKESGQTKFHIGEDLGGCVCVSTSSNPQIKMNHGQWACRGLILRG